MSLLKRFELLFLDELELLRPEAFLDHGFLALKAPEPDVDLLGGLIAARHLGELAHVADLAPACFLAVDPVEAGRLAFLDLLDLVYLVVPAERTIRCEFRWHFHENFTDDPWVSNTYIICKD